MGYPRNLLSHRIFIDLHNKEGTLTQAFQSENDDIDSDDSHLEHGGGMTASSTHEDASYMSHLVLKTHHGCYLFFV
jgi:hypothetical protein